MAQEYWMTRLFALVSASLFAAACSSHPSQGAGSAAGSASGAAGSSSAGGSAGSSAGGSAVAGGAGSGQGAKPETALAQVQASVASGMRVAPSEIVVRGV